MAKLTAVTEADLKSKAAQVFFEVQDMGELVEVACKKAGITERQYYYWVVRAQPVIEQMREGMQAVYREELARIYFSRPQILARVIEDGLSSFTAPIDRLAILQHLEERAERLMEKTAPTDSTGLNDLLGAPMLAPGVSRFVDRGLDIEPAEGGGVTIRPRYGEIIDGTATTLESIEGLDREEQA